MYDLDEGRVCTFIFSEFEIDLGCPGETNGRMWEGLERLRRDGQSSSKHPIADLDDREVGIRGYLTDRPLAPSSRLGTGQRGCDSGR